jgi:hypothetical protein
MTAQQLIPGEVQLRTVSLFAQRGVVNIVELVKYLSIYESIFTAGIMVELTIWDAAGLATNLPILGGERIVIEYEAPGRKTRELELVVIAMKEGGVDPNMRSKGYILFAATPEVARNQSVQVNKSYNTNTSNMVQDIVKTYLKSDKKVDIQKTKGIQKVLVQSQKPFDAISMLRKRSVSVEDKSSAFVFFENKEGFHFKTIEKLMGEGGVGDRTFTNDPTRVMDASAGRFRNLLSYEQPDQFDALKRLDGGLAEEVRKFDYKTLKYETKVHKFSPGDYKNPDGTLKDPDSEEFKRFGKTAGSNVWVAHDSGMPETHIAESTGQKSGAIALLGQGRLLIHVMGDSELTAGQQIELQIIENTTASQAPEEHKMLSGKYIIAFLHHIILPEGNNPRYTCSAEVIKGGYKDLQK